MRVRLATSPFDPQDEERRFTHGRDDVGALVSFVGLCRAQTNGRAVRDLFLDHYPGFSEQEIARIVADIAQRCACPDLFVIHRVGPISPGEAIVLVAALSAHRANAFDAVRLIMDYLKTDAPLWKRETGPDGATYWIEPREADRAARALAEGTRA